jgi:hypothetical protein
MCLRALRLVIAFRSRHLVGNGQPNRQDNVEQKRAQQNDFKDLYNIVCAHEITKGIVPFATVVAENEQVGGSVKQQEDAQEDTKQCHKDFLADGVDFR